MSINLLRAKPRQSKLEADKAIFSSETHVVQGDSALVYVSGWLVREYLTCMTCKVFLTSQETTPFIQYKTFSFVKPDAMISPSHIISKTLIAWEKLFIDYMSKSPYLPCIKSSLINVLSKHISLPNVCLLHLSLPQDILNKFITFRLNAYCRFFNSQVRYRNFQKKHKLTRLNT
jgi:hypothetical protein